MNLPFFSIFKSKNAKDGIFINQIKYVNELLNKYRMDHAKHTRTPMATNEKLNLDKDKKPISEKVSWNITSLLYSTASRPDIMFSVCLFARFQASLKSLIFHL